MSREIESMELDEATNAVTKGAKPAEKTSLKNDAEDLGGPDVKTYKPDEKESIGKKAAAKIKHEGSKSISTKPSAASSSTQDTISKKPTFEEVEEVEGEVLEESDLSLEEDLEALVAGLDLNEESQYKAKVIFEAAVTARVNEEVAQINEAYEQAFEEAVAEFKTEMSEQIDSYLTFVAEKWIEENQIAIDNGIKTEIAEGFMNGLKNLFMEHNMDVPEEKFDLVDSMVEQLDVMEQKLNEQIEVNVEMHKKLGDYIKNGIVNEVSVGLAETQKDKLASLSEGVEFTTEEEYREKIEILKESYFSRAAAPAVEDTPVEQPLVEDAMSAYAAAISRWSSKQA